jgi:hypothetical protein
MTLAALDVTASELEKPPAYIKNITLSTAGNELVVAIDFVIKQFFKGSTSAVQQLASREELRDKLYILLIATTDKEVALNIAKRPSLLRQYLTFKDTVATKTKVLSLDDARISINNSFDLTPVQLGKLYGTDLPFNEVMRFTDNANPDYLSLFAVSFINLNASESPTPATLNDVAFGKISSDLVLKGGAVNTKSLIFYKRNGADSKPTLWVGDVHQSRAGTWRTGATAAPVGVPPIGEPLYAKSVYNTKISDNRSIERMQKMQLNFNNAKLLQGLSGDFALKAKAINDAKTRTPTYITDAYYSKNIQNDLKFYFAINFLDIIKENGTYSTLYSSLADLLSSCSILSFNVIRRRVKKGNIYNKLTGGDSPFRMYDDKIHIIGSPTQIKILSPNPGVLNYMIADTQMNDITTGLYEYGVEIEVLDDTKEKFVSVLTALHKAIPEVEDFITLSLTRGNYNGLLNRYSSGFVKELKKTYAGDNIKEAPWTKAIEAYASGIALLMGGSYAKSGIGVNSLIDDLYMVATPTNGSPEGLQYLVKLLQDFVSALKTVVGTSSIKKPGSSQTLATPSNSFSSKKRIFKIRQFFETPFDADSLVNMGLDFLNTAITATAHGTGLRHVTTTEWLNIAANESDKTNNLIPSGNVGFLTPNFLRLPVGSPVNLYSQDGATRQDVDKLTYQLLLANMDQNSPIAFKKGKNIKTATKINRKEASKAAQQTSIMNNNSCIVKATLKTAENPVTSMFEDVEDLTPQKEDHTVLEDSNVLFSADSSFARSTTGTAEISGSTDTKLIEAGTSPSAPGQKVDAKANTSLIANYLVQSDFFNGPPAATKKPLRGGKGAGYLKNNDTDLLQYQAAVTKPPPRRPSPSLALRGAGLGAYDPGVSPQEIEFAAAAFSGSLSPPDLASNAIKYGFIYTVEYLAGYGRIGDTNLIKSPVWLKLEQGILASIQAADASLLCRLNKHSSLISDFEGLKAPIYNELFIIGADGTSFPRTLPPPKATSAPTPVKLSTEVAQSTMATADTIEYSNSYDSEARVGAKSTRTATRLLREAAKQPVVKQRPAGNTTIDDGHRHTYTVDRKGNGVAREVCQPADSTNCHTHQIIRGTVQAAGHRPHSHRLVLTKATNGSNKPSRSPGTNGRRTGKGGASTGEGDY